MIRHLIFSALFLCLCAPLFSQPIPASIQDNQDGTFTLLRGGEPYYIEGAGADNLNYYAELAARGGNSLRTWGVGPNTPNVLDVAHANGLSVTLGLWIPHGFDFGNPAAEFQLVENFRNAVIAYRDHPALLAWGIGNEMEAGQPDLAPVYALVNQISEMIHQEDPNHLTLTVTAGISVNKADAIAEHAPDLDLLGVNMYGGIGVVPNVIANSNWNKPYLLTEWGVNGNWEVPKTTWNAALEPNSSEKAEMFANRYQNIILPNAGTLLGSHAFLWNSKVEGSQTWFGLFVGDETTEMIDVLQHQWTGEWAANRAPLMNEVTLNGQVQSESVILTSVDSNWVEVDAFDLEGDELTYEYLVRPQTGTQGVEPIPGATFDAIPGIVAETDGNRARLAFNGEQNLRNFRLYVFVRDGNGHVGTASFPFRVELEASGGAAGVYNAVQDAYVRDGFYHDKTLGQADFLRLQTKLSEVEGYTRETYLRFDLAEAPEEFAGVTLQLYGAGPEGVAVEVYGFGDDPWDEQTLTWDDRIAPTTGPLDVIFLGPGDAAWYNWDVTSFIVDQFAQDNRVLSLVLRGTESYIGDAVTWESKEAAVHPPRLFFENATAAREPVVGRLTLFPNPAGEVLQLRLPGGFSGRAVAQVLSANGQILKTLRLPAGAGSVASIPVGELRPGLYLLALTNENGGDRWIGRFVKN